MGNAHSQQGGLQLEENQRCAQDLTSYWAKATPLLRGHAQFQAVLQRNDAALLRSLDGGAGAGSTLRDAQGFTPLHLCISVGWVEGARALLEAGADPNCRSNAQYTPLHLAAVQGNLQAVAWLIERGAQVDLRSAKGSTALHFAAQSATPASKAVLGHLLERGALATAHGFRNRSPLQLAVCSHGDVEVVSALLAKGGDPGEANPSTRHTTPLHTTAHLGRVDCMALLLEAGANPDSRTDDGMTPLMEVFRHQHGPTGEAKKRAMAKLLIEAGANVNLVPPSGFGLLHFAFQACGDPETIEMLLGAGLDASYNIDKPLSRYEAGGKTRCLHVAARRGWAGLAELLVRAGADPELKDNEGFAPLHLAVLHKHARVVARLLALGADPLSHCPDIYPSYARWRLERSLRAMHALMQAEGPPGNVQQIMQTAMSGQGGPTCSAVDLAVGTLQHLPTVEAFVDAGVTPSAAALQRGVADSPIMRAIVQRPLWTPELHRRLPRRFRMVSRELLLCLRRAAGPITLPPDVVAQILTRAAFPVSDWANPLWLAAQRTRHADREGRAAPGGGPGAPGGGGHPPFAAAAAAAAAGEVANVAALQAQAAHAAGLAAEEAGGAAGGGPAPQAQGAGGGGLPGAAHGLPAGLAGAMPGGVAAVMQHIMGAVQEQLAGGANAGFIPLPPGLMEGVPPEFFGGMGGGGGPGHGHGHGQGGADSEDEDSDAEEGGGGFGAPGGGGPPGGGGDEDSDDEGGPPGGGGDVQFHMPLEQLMGLGGPGGVPAIGGLPFVFGPGPPLFPGDALPFPGGGGGVGPFPGDQMAGLMEGLADMPPLVDSDNEGEEGPGLVPPPPFAFGPLGPLFGAAAGPAEDHGAGGEAQQQQQDEQEEEEEEEERREAGRPHGSGGQRGRKRHSGDSPPPSSRYGLRSRAKKAKKD
eukprot:scaffold5.g687.t1